MGDEIPETCNTHYQKGEMTDMKERIVICCSHEKEIPEKVREKVMVKLGHRLGARGNAVMTRLNDDDLEKIDSLVEVELFKSRSEAAAFFIKEGIQAGTDLAEKVMPTVEKIKELRKQARESLGKIQEESETSTDEEVEIQE